MGILIKYNLHLYALQHLYLCLIVTPVTFVVYIDEDIDSVTTQRTVA